MDDLTMVGLTVGALAYLLVGSVVVRFRVPGESWQADLRAWRDAVPCVGGASRCSTYRPATGGAPTYAAALYEVVRAKEDVPGNRGGLSPPMVEWR